MDDTTFVPLAAGDEPPEQTPHVVRMSHVDRTASLFDLYENFPLPHGWSLAEAREGPADEAWHAPVMDWICLAAQKSITTTTYLDRHAILVWCLYERGPWSPPGRKGAAYVALIGGLRDHGFRARDGEQGRLLAILDPAPDFFERFSGADELGTLLNKVYEHTVEPKPDCHHESQLHGED